MAAGSGRGRSTLVLAADGVVEGEGEFHEAVEEGETCSLNVGVRALGAVGDAGGSGVLDQGDRLGEEPVGALVEAVQELVGEGEFVVGPFRSLPAQASDQLLHRNSSRRYRGCQ
ncbi:hypothetical protein [Streptomyces sp. NPDC102264]|uniref:hypothetical protein n=1 Tax=Streptomyces sp. NPDC102264 TaxID=3366149 RepID=UPI0038308B30